MHTARFSVTQGRLLVVARPTGPDRALAACSGNLALADPAGCDPAVLSATGKVAEVIRARRPVADLVIEDPAELTELWDRLAAMGPARSVLLPPGEERIEDK
jgi:hypothetical protein